MQISMLGYPGSGRTTLFRALAGSPDADSTKPLTVTVPDGRLSILSSLLRPSRTTGVSVRFEDVPSPAFSPDRLASVRGSTALLLVLDNFCSGSLAARLSDAETELVLSDLQVVEKRAARLVKEGSAGSREHELLLRLASALGDGLPCRTLDLPDDEVEMLSSFSLLSLKPLLVAVNGSQHPPDDESSIAPLIERSGCVSVPVDAHFELELTEIEDPEERRQFLEAMGYEGSGLERIISAALEVMDLILFYTIKGSEISIKEDLVATRAWSIPAGSTALEAAAAIHTDTARGFVRARVVDYESFVSSPDMKSLRADNRLRTEGKDYRVRDGEIIEILFSC